MPDGFVNKNNNSYFGRLASGFLDFKAPSILHNIWERPNWVIRWLKDLKRTYSSGMWMVKQSWTKIIIEPEVFSG